MNFGDFDDLLEINSIHDLWNQESTNQFAESIFINKAREHNLLTTEIKTIFIPPNEVVSSLTEDFTTFFRRHVSRTFVQINGPENIIYVQTLSSICYSVYFDKAQLFIGGTKIHNYNDKFESFIIHTLESCIPIIRIHNIESLPLVTISYQDVKIDLGIINVDEVTLHINFVYYDNRKNIGGTFKICCVKNVPTIAHIQIPKVESLQKSMMWIQLFSNSLGIPIISWLRPQNITIYPNPMIQENPEIIEFAPLRGTTNNPLFIHGKNFSPETLRVNVGEKSAIVYYCTNILIKCIIPFPDSQEKKCNIQVTNGNVFTTAKFPFVYVD